MKHWFKFDDETVSGWQFLLRNIVGGVGLLLFVVPGLWIWCANGYKRAGAFNWSVNYRIAGAIAIPIAQVSNLIQRLDGYADLPINILDIIAFPCGILSFVMLVKNGNKKTESAVE